MKIIKNISLHLIAPLASCALVVIFFQLWNLDFSKPVFGYSHDSLFSIFLIKTTINSGWFFQNYFVGYPHIDGGFYLHDFPIQADSFNFFLIKIFTIFSNNPFLITNCFFILTFALISFTSFIVLRAFNISILSSILVSVLYAFIPYHLLRNVSHLFLSNYAAVPLTIMVSLWIANNKIKLVAMSEKECLFFAPNRFFFIAFLISCFVAANGIYYAFYSCVIFIFAWFLRCLRSGSFLNREIFATATLCGAIFVALLLLYLPSFLYWFDNGMNRYVANRNPGDSEYYGLRIVDLFLPAANHYLEYFRNLRLFFDEALINGERNAEGLGILAASGFMFLLLWLPAKSQDGENSFLQKTIRKFSLSDGEQNLISNLAGLNFLSVLFATVGGLVMFVAMPFPLIRSHARFCIFIAFFSLFLVALLFDKVRQSHDSKKIPIVISLIFISFLALLDQVGNLSYGKDQIIKMQNRFDADKNFITKVEATLAPNSQVFILPIFGFPETVGDGYESLINNLHSDNLRWSYPAINGRKSFLWQKEVEQLDFKDFISELKKAGFVGIFIDRYHFAKGKNDKDIDGWKRLQKLEKQLHQVSKSPALVAPDMSMIFFKI